MKDIMLALKELGITKKQAHIIYNVMFNVIKDKLLKNESVKIQKFGTFYLKDRNARKGRNINTNELVEIPATKAICFRPSKTFKEEVDRIVSS